MGRGRAPRGLPPETSALIRTTMPISIELIDAVNGESFTVEKGDVLEMLRIHPEEILGEAAEIAASYVYFSRAHRACERMAVKAQVNYVQWKARIAVDARKASETKLTGAQVEEAYRTHEDYVEMAEGEGKFIALSGLFEDCKRAVRMKADKIRDFLYAQGAQARTDLDDLEKHARSTFAQQDQQWRTP